MGQLSRIGVSYLLWWVAAYGVLAGLYVAFGALISQINLRRKPYRIQIRTCPDALVRRDFFQSLRSLVSISGMLAAGMALRESGMSVGIADLSPGSFIGWTVVSLILFDTWFYWGHRLLHSRWLYRRIHQWHHRTVTPTVWSNNSDTLLDNLFLQSYWLVSPILLPAPTAVLVAHKVWDQITGMLGHAGYEYAPGKLSARPSPLIGTTFHDQHHEFFRCNYATHFSVWDRMMGTLHPGYDNVVSTYSRRDGTNQ